MEEGKSQKLDLPGFRFHPTEEELLDFYLKNVVLGKRVRCDVIGYLNIYCHDPSELPGLSKIGEREWYFLVPIDRKHGSGGGRRPNRTTANGFWKATGSDRKIVSLSEPKRVLGFRKTLVFYYGRAPRGTKTDWVMNEYRLPDSSTLPKVQDIVLCKIYRKATSLKVLEQRAALEEEIKASNNYQQQSQFQSPTSSPLSSMDTLSFCSQQEDATTLALHHHMALKQEIPEDLVLKNEKPTKQEVYKGPSLQLPFGKDKLPELQLPNKVDLDWSNQDNSFLLTSPWLQTFTPTFYANILTPAPLSEPEFNCR